MNASSSNAGFSLVELMVSAAILVVVVAGSLTLYLFYQRSSVATTLMDGTTRNTSMALERLVYGMGDGGGLRSASATNIVVTYPAGGWRVAVDTNRWFTYNPGAERITDQDGQVLCEQVDNSAITPDLNGCRVQLATYETRGGRRMTNLMETYVQYRN